MFWRARSFVRFLLPLSVAITAAWAVVVVSRDTSFHGWTRWAVLGVAAVAIAVLLAGLRRTGLVAALVAVLLTPAVWSVATAATANSNGGMAAAGPAERGGAGFEIFTNGQPPPNVRGTGSRRRAVLPEAAGVSSPTSRSGSCGTPRRTAAAPRSRWPSPGRPRPRRPTSWAPTRS